MARPMHELEITETTDATGQRLLALSGEIDLQTIAKLSERINEEADRTDLVVLNLGEVRFMDSPGLGCLIHSHLRLTEHGVRLVLRSPRAHVRELFDLVQLGSLLTIEDTD
jgi:anti-anti-sigma factor